MHLSRLPSGAWRVAVKHQGKRATGTAPTRAQAQHLGARLLLDLGGTPSAGGRHAVAELLDVWRDDLTTRGRSPAYRDDARRVAERLPAPFLERQVAKVTPMVAQALLAQLVREGWTVHRVRRAHEMLSSAWSLACSWEWAVANPWAHVSRPPAPPPRSSAPDPAVVLRVLNAAPADLRLFLALAAITGARRGELVGLQWSAIDRSTVRIGATLRHNPIARTVEQGGGKTGRKGHRTVTVDHETAAALAALHARQSALSAAAGLPVPVWVFSHDAGHTPWRPDYVTRTLSRLRAKAGAPTLRLHDLRHFTATQLLARGIPAKAVADRLGHARVGTTTDRYGHAVPAADQAATEAIADVLGRSTTPRRRVVVRRRG